MTKSVSLTGTCLCGAVAFTVADDFSYALNCHCSQCRRTTGSAFKPFAGIERAKLVLTAGADRLQIYGEELTHNVRCSACGSLLYSVVREGQYVHVPLGVLSSAPSLMPTAHICVGSKASWYVINDDLPQHEGLPP